MPIAKQFRFLTALVVVLVALAGCGGQQAAAPTAPAAPIVAPTAPPPTTAPVAPTIVPLTTPVPVSAPAPTQAPVVAPTATTAPTPEAAPANPTTDPITGAPAFGRGAVVRHPYVVMIDNHPNAYPQSGLDRAAVVFEALAEFGITRFVALYAPGITPDLDEIGPVRSTRLYFVQWAISFHGLYIHAGGSPQGLALVESTDQLINLDALRNDGSPFFVRSSSRPAPHNLYTSSANLARAADVFKVGEYTYPTVGFLFKPDAPEAQRPASQELNYYFIYQEEHAGWTYDSKTNSYLRLRRGNPAIDAVTGKQLRMKNVVVMEVPEAPIPGDPKGRIEQAVIGSGRARVFMDGMEREVTWRKESPEAQLNFYDASGEEVRLNAGQVWIVALPTLDNLKVS